MSLALNHWVKNHHKYPGDRAYRRRQELPRLRSGPKGLSRWPRNPVTKSTPTAAGDCGFRLDGRYAKLIASISKCEVLILDDLLIFPDQGRTTGTPGRLSKNVMTVRQTIVTSQLAQKAWHAAMQDLTLADAILDRLVHNAYKLELKGESMRRKRSMLDPYAETVTG